MKRYRIKKIVALFLIMVLTISGGIEAKAGTDNVIYLLGVHDFDGTTDKGHGNFCSWLGESAKSYRKEDSTATIVKRHYSKNTTALNIMRKYNYLMIITHGAEDRIAFYDNNGKKTKLYADRIRNDGNYIYGQLKVCHIMACQAADVARAISERGAKVTIGYRERVTLPAGTTMMEQFNVFFASGQSVVAALSNARACAISKDGPDYGLNSCVIFGDGQRRYN